MGEPSNDAKLIMFYESAIAKRKPLSNADLWLADLKDTYEAMMPHLNASEPAKRYIKDIIDDAIKAISK